MPSTKFMPKKGFTLMEVLVVVSILIVVGGSIFGLLLSSQTNFGIVHSRLELTQRTNQALNQISELLMQAAVGTFNIGPDADTIKFQRPYEDSQLKQIELDGDGKICLGSSVKDGSFLIDLQNSQLILHDLDSSGTEIVANRKILANHINGITFSYGNERIGISIVAKKTDWQGRDIQTSLNTQIAPHN